MQGLYSLSLHRKIILFPVIEAEISNLMGVYNIGKEKIEFRVAKSINYIKAMTEKSRKEAAHDYHL